MIPYQPNLNSQLKGNDHLLSSSAESADHGDSPSLLSLDPGVGIWAIVVFVCLLLILKKFAWGPIISSIDEREKNIRDSLDKAKQAQNESKQIANEQNKILSEAKAEAAHIIQQAKSAAEEFASKIKVDAQDEKNRILDSGLKEIESAKQAAISSLKKETGDLAIEIAGKLVGQAMDAQKHKEYVDKLIEDLEKPKL